MSKQGFQLLSHYSDGTQKFRQISIPNLIDDQKKLIADMLTSILKELEAEHKAHREKFKMTKLADIFPETLEYAFEKAGNGIYEEPRGLEQWGIDQIKVTVHSFLDAVEQRDKGIAQNLADDYQYIDHAIARVEQIIATREQHTSQPIDQLDGHIYLSFLRQRVEDLRRYASEIDEDYNT